MKKHSILGKVGLVTFCTLFLAACGDDSPDLLLESGNSNLNQVAPAGPTEVGKTKTETFTFRNFKDHGVLVKQISGVTAPFYRMDSSTCKEGELLPGQGACTVVVTHVPTAAASSVATLSISYAREKNPNELRPSADVAVTALSSLNCGATATLAQKRTDGVNAATQRNQSEAAAGTAKGQSLTYDDGKQLGYKQGYAAGYEKGYRSAYQRYFESGRTQGYGEGAGSSEAITQGTTHGQYDGYKKGYAEGTGAGESDGYQQGYNDGTPGGYSDGYADGQYACNGSGAVAKGAVKSKSLGTVRPTSLRSLSQAIGAQPPSSEQILNDPATQQACVKQGYDATYSADSFQRAYDAAAAVNAPYQAGLRDGYAVGLNGGNSDGLAAGQVKGYKDGRDQGYQEGYEYTFNAYYQTSYQSAYYNSYRSSYDDAYRTGSSRGYDAGYQDGYKAGYADGVEDAGCQVD